MNKEDAIKYLQQLYPNGGHCWLDEQRIEAIGIAVKALQEEPVSEQNLSNVERTVKNWKEPVSEELEDAAIEICSEILKGETVIIDGYEYVVFSDAEECFKAGAQWQKEQMMAKAIDAQCFGFQGAALFSFKLPADKYLVGSKVKVFVIKED